MSRREAITLATLQINQALFRLQTVVGLLITIAGIMVMRRNADPAVKLLTVWGGFWLFVGLWSEYARAAVTRAAISTTVVNTVSGVGMIIGRLLPLVTAVYALWRFWRGATGANKVD